MKAIRQTFCQYRNSEIRRKAKLSADSLREIAADYPKSYWLHEYRAMLDESVRAGVPIERKYLDSYWYAIGDPAEAHRAIYQLIKLSISYGHGGFLYAQPPARHIKWGVAQSA